MCGFRGGRRNPKAETGLWSDVFCKTSTVHRLSSDFLPRPMRRRCGRPRRKHCVRPSNMPASPTGRPSSSSVRLGLAVAVDRAAIPTCQGDGGVRNLGLALGDPLQRRQPKIVAAMQQALIALPQLWKKVGCAPRRITVPTESRIFLVPLHLALDRQAKRAPAPRRAAAQSPARRSPSMPCFPRGIISLRKCAASSSSALA